MKLKTANWVARTILLPGIILFIALVVIVGRHHGRTAAEAPSDQLRAQQLPVGAVSQSFPVDPQVKKTIDGMIGTGVVRVDTNLRRAWIEPSAWLQANAHSKEQITRGLAAYVSPDNPMVTLYDNRSTRELASYGPFDGFKVNK